MKKLHTYFALALLVFLACIPPISFFISLPPMDIWFVMILMAGFFGLYTVFLSVNRVIPFIAISSFILCFFSASPPISFTSYVSIVLCCYFYINCTKIEDWSIIFRAFQTLLLLNILIVVMQYFGWDSLLNFGLGKDITGFGIIGQHMQMGSFSVILSAVLLPFSLLNLIFPLVIAFFCSSTWTLLCAGVGGGMYFYSKNKNAAAMFSLVLLVAFAGLSIKYEKFHSSNAENGRIVVWQKSLKFAMQKPLTGWGPGTYKMLFPAMGMTAHRDIPYKSAHNWIVQLLFEMGIPFTATLLITLGWLAYRLYIAKELLCLMSLAMIVTDMMVHFPDRMLQTVGIIICFLAYCEIKLHKE